MMLDYLEFKYTKTKHKCLRCARKLERVDKTNMVVCKKHGPFWVV